MLPVSNWNLIMRTSTFIQLYILVALGNVHAKRNIEHDTYSDAQTLQPCFWIAQWRFIPISGSDEFAHISTTL